MRRNRLVALTGEPASVDAARAVIAALPPTDMIVTASRTAFAAAAAEGRLRTFDPYRSAEAIAAEADDVVEFGAVPESPG